MFVTGSVSLRDIYSHLDAPMLIMLAALIPISDALKTTGTTDVIAQLAFSNRGDAASLWGSCTYLSCRLAVAPFLNNAATVLVMLPIAPLAENLGFQPDAFLTAVAIGAGYDFPTPVGHQCNTAVMGPSGYRFGDYPRGASLFQLSSCLSECRCSCFV
ncbi:SLC13 family permease [Pararhizobium sp. DWP1-1-3]|uniref:SLC13 family permease n=1 Tax=Pararhizobium sp. DWP1-1-3 TaxID=2804652 RepID=UPI003CFBACE9